MIVDGFFVKNKIKNMNNSEIAKYCAKNKDKMSCHTKEFALLQYASNLQEELDTHVSSIDFEKMNIEKDNNEARKFL